MSFTTLGKRNYTILRHILNFDIETEIGLGIEDELGNPLLIVNPLEATGQYVDGEWIEVSSVDLAEFTIRANIQPSMASYRTQLLPEGDRNKEAVTLFSNDWLYTARSGVAYPDGNNAILKGDLILYRGGYWEVVVSRPYGNFGEHCEALAIKLNDSLIPRVDGDIENIT